MKHARKRARPDKRVHKNPGVRRRESKTRTAGASREDKESWEKYYTTTSDPSGGPGCSSLRDPREGKIKEKDRRGNCKLPVPRGRLYDKETRS